MCTTFVNSSRLLSHTFRVDGLQRLERLILLGPTQFARVDIADHWSLRLSLRSYDGMKYLGVSVCGSSPFLMTSDDTELEVTLCTLSGTEIASHKARVREIQYQSHEDTVLHAWHQFVTLEAFVLHNREVRQSNSALITCRSWTDDMSTKSLARMFCIRSAATQALAIQSLSAPEDCRDIKFLLYNCNPEQHPNSPGIVKPVFVSSKLLSLRSNHFSSYEVFSEGHSGNAGMPDFEATFDYLSDSDLESDDGDTSDIHEDAKVTHAATPSDVAEPTSQWKCISIGDIAHKTWLAIMFYLYTDTVNFAPLTSQETPVVIPTSPGDHVTNDSKIEPENMAPLVSCKSVFKAAEKLGLKDLEELAFGHLKSQINDSVIFHEIFSSFTSRYDKVKDMECEYLFSNWERLKDSPVLNEKLADDSRNANWLLRRVLTKAKGF